MGTCDFSVIASWLSLDLHIGMGVSLPVCSLLLRHLSIDCFWLTASVILLLVIIVSFACTTLLLFMFCVMRNSPNCDIFYGVIILTTVCFNTVKIEKLEI